jgi:hypothetical protein
LGERGGVFLCAGNCERNPGKRKRYTHGKSGNEIGIDSPEDKYMGNKGKEEFQVERES